MFEKREAMVDVITELLELVAIAVIQFPDSGSNGETRINASSRPCLHECLLVLRKFTHRFCEPVGPIGALIFEIRIGSEMGVVEEVLGIESVTMPASLVSVASSKWRK